MEWFERSLAAGAYFVEDPQSSALSVGKWIAGETFEDSNGAAVRFDHGASGNDKCLLKGVLTFENRVADTIRKNNPT